MARGGLDKEKIGAAALALADEGGLGAVTARNLAERLGVTPMAIYRHVPNLGAVVEGLLERVLLEARILEHAPRVLDEFLVETFARVYACLVAHPAVIPLLGTSARFGSDAVAIGEAVLGRLAAAGYPPSASVRVFHALVSYTIGAACVRAAMEATKEPPAGRGFDAAPHIRAATDPLLRFGSERTFRSGLELLIETTLAASAAKRPAEPRRRR